MTEPLTTAEIAILNEARRILAVKHSSFLYDESQASGMAHNAADVAEQAIFSFMSTARVWLEWPITDEQLHEDSRKAEPQSLRA